MSEQSSIASERLIFRPETGPTGDVLVTLLLRGGIDGLYAIPPLADPDYGRQRAAFDASAPHHHEPIPLDDFFGLHFNLEPLLELYKRELLAVVHACGPTQPLLSHFDAMRLLEQASGPTGPKDGWLGRHLASQTGASSSPLRAIAVGSSVPLVLRGVAGARALDTLENLRLALPVDWKPGFMTALARMYAPGPNPLSAIGRGTLATLAAVDRLSQQVNAAEKPLDVGPSVLAKQLQMVARLIKAEVGLEAAVLTQGGWDTHCAQAKEIDRPMRYLGAALRYFVDALGDRIERVTVVVLSEFGRRVAPNGAGGTDHGRGSTTLVLGGGIRGGKVYARWPGLAPDALDHDGNLVVTTDFRDVLAEIVDRRLRNAQVDRIFPQYKPNYLGLTTG
ncbi:MAG TPA: DUF1501 domain-containing protein [Pirellulales bacterium]|jgi:uncharacterized protein (DUF1501 family)|nr:DUF1501 domain-containing protein [Pirellulales bacterium]